MAAKKEKTAKKTKASKMSFKKRTVKFIKENNLHVVFVVAVVLGALYVFRGVFIAATVNGEPITRLAVIKDLETQGGQDVLDSMVTEKLIEQEAKKRNIEVSDEQVQAEIDSYSSALEDQGTDLETALLYQGMSMVDFRSQVETQLLIEKMFGSDIEVSDEEIAQYKEENADYLTDYTDEDELNSMVHDQVVQQKLSEEFYNWLTSAQQEANIKYLVNYGS